VEVYEAQRFLRREGFQGAQVFEAWRFSMRRGF